MPKGILKKAMRSFAVDTQDVVVPLNDVNNANMDESGSMKNKEDANLVKGDTTAVIAKSCSLADSHGNKDPSTAATSFANVVRPKDSFSKVHFRALINEEKIESFDCVLLKAATAKVKSMDQVLEKGPWLIRKSPIILNKWTASVSLKKGEVTKVPIWVKLYNVPVLAYSEDGLSLITTQIGKPIMLDAFTSSMCVESWGRISFALALIEISAHSVLKKEVTMAIPDEEGDGHTKEVIRVVYEWKPPHCVDCQSFGHDTNLRVVRRRWESDSRYVGGLRLNKPNSKVIWQQKKGVDAKGGSSASPSVSTNDNGKAINDVQEDKNVSSSPALKTWDCIKICTDDEDVIPLYGSSLGGGNQLEDEDFDFSDGYEDQVVDLPGQLKEFRNFKLHMCGRK
ncbi:retrovirus-related pol polyprotein from transposon TNT 1-94 [Tanacetum coccineum]